MLDQNRLRFVKQMGASSQTRVTSIVPSTVNSPELQLLWTSYKKSKAFKRLVSLCPSNALHFNYMVLMSWACFLENNHITVPVDHHSIYRQDMISEVSAEISKLLTNLKLYKVIPMLRADTFSTQVVLPKVDNILDPLNILYQPKIKLLIEYVPKKKNLVDLRRLQGPKLVKAGLDTLLDQMQGYLYRSRDEYLKYNKPMSTKDLMELSEYQWSVKDRTRFRHNGSSLAVQLVVNYSGVIPKSDSHDLLNAFPRTASGVLRKLK